MSMQISNANRIQLPIVLDFHSEDGKERVADWYASQPTTRFTSIEYRKDTAGRFGHEFILAHLDNSTVCRFDRRAREDMRGHALKDEGTISEDSAHVITLADKDARADLDKSQVVLRMNVPKGEDLKFILAVCYGIQSHSQAKLYSLLCYNCYFFSWTLVLSIYRRACGWEAPAKRKELQKVFPDLILKSLDQVDLSSFPKHRSLGARLSARFGLSGSKSMLPSIKECYFESVKQALAGPSFCIPRHSLATVLLRSQLSTIVSTEIHFFLWEVRQAVINQYMAKVTKKARSGVLASSDLDPQNRDAPPPPEINRDSWFFSEARVRRKAESICTELQVQTAFHACSLIEPVLLDNLPDSEFIGPDGRREALVFFEGSWRAGDAIQYCIMGRMIGHCERVGGYGLGSPADLFSRIQESMYEIWASVVDMEGKPSFLSPAT